MSDPCFRDLGPSSAEVGPPNLLECILWPPIVHRYRERGDSRQAIEDLAPVILVAAAITLLGYGTLVTSSYPPLRSIGLVSAVSIVTLAAASLFVLPAMLARYGRGKV